jgi:hypothetical protein
MKPFDFTVLLDVIAGQLGLEWVRVPGAAGGAAGTPDAPRALPFIVTPLIAAHCAEIERLVRIGHVRSLEAEIDAMATLAPEAGALAEQMRAALDSFDLKALTNIARTVRPDAT